ncbi:hypothetical protein [Actinoalloteichus fjordicus]|uniref:Uncharacterized protein n=1 Tax=Actinoalloteichus fjordicus TaxID=1612552 RepID=A0AAC9LA17_9PSEU|nr:hypothetical protein [Actinoalloteichus fjordicus]APU13556.1 hypothetical protein UA74_07435 [Actinoalloteichus fjordicus]
MSLKVSLLAGFFQGPLFYHDPEEDRWASHDVELAGEDLSLSPQLVADLTAWDEEYQAIYDDNYPPDSKFSTPEAEWAWIERGKVLAARIKQESPLVASVDYQAHGHYERGTCVF